ncbi:MAG TPA: hypothetical protein VHV79_02710 [Mycobacteriales bacterium]|nr:hypothetical protein [Mycobacteriales bacterium]
MLTRRRIPLFTLAATAALVVGISAPSGATPRSSGAQSVVAAHWKDIHGDTTNGLSCPTIKLCVGVDANKVTWSTNPTAGKPHWKHVALEPSSQPTVTTGGVILTVVSCAGPKFCLAADDLGNTFATRNPTGGKRAWHEADVNSIELLSLSCSAPSLCAAIDYYGNALISTDPGAAVPTWRSVSLAANRDGDPPGLSCVGHSVCAAVMGSSKIFYTTNANAARPRWKHVKEPGRGGWDGISCPTASRCVAVGALDFGSHVAVTSNLAAGELTWKSTKVHNKDNDLSTVDCATKSFCFATTDMYTTHAAAKPSAWHAVKAPSSGSQTDVSCATSKWCFISTIDGTFAWHR